jgi:hypothetical protein
MEQPYGKTIKSRKELWLAKGTCTSSWISNCLKPGKPHIKIVQELLRGKAKSKAENLRWIQPNSNQRPFAWMTIRSCDENNEIVFHFLNIKP